MKADRQTIFQSMQDKARSRDDSYKDIEAILEQYIRDAQAAALEEAGKAIHEQIGDTRLINSGYVEAWLNHRAQRIQEGEDLG